MKYLILGAGPAGLTFANLLKKKGINSFLVLEKEKTAGGLCRTEIVDGFPLDIGGGHFLDENNKKANDFLFDFMPRSEWNLFKRISLISIYKMYISHPIEANIWQFPENIQEEYLKSIAQAGCNQNKQKPERFIDWISWKLGNKVAEDYMLPYNQKMFAENLNNLGTYWLEKLPDVSYEDTLKSCREHKAYGKEPGHTWFYYPKSGGYGELWKKIAENIEQNIQYHKEIEAMDLDNKCVTTSDGKTYNADCIITTIPWRAFRKIEGFPVRVRDSMNQLAHSSIEIRYFAEDINTKAHWIYYPDLQLPFHRCLFRKNFALGSRGYWTETRKERVNLFTKAAAYKYVNEYAYPLNTVHKPEIMRELMHCAEGKGVYALGRWGEHMHYNSDVVVEKSMELFERIEGNA